MGDSWQYYKHAFLPTSAPHELVDIEMIKNGKIWRIHGGGDTSFCSLDK